MLQIIVFDRALSFCVFKSTIVLLHCYPSILFDIVLGGVEPSYGKWAPYIGNARSAADAYNTESQKISHSSAAVKEDEQMEVHLSEDLLLELISEKKVGNVA